MKILLILCTLLLSSNLNATTMSSIRDCSVIIESSERLACFDKMAKNILQNSGKIKTISTSEKAFGASLLEKKDAPKVEKITSKMKGNFKEWKEGLIITLENGQKWRVNNSPRGYKKLSNPNVVITKGIFGTFNMKIEGLNSSAKVKRIK